MADTRNWLFAAYRDLLATLRPDAFLFENVPGLLNIDGGRVFDSIVAALAGAGYAIETWKLRAEQYGVPQRRTRLFVVGRRLSPPPRGVFRLPPPICGSANGIFPLHPPVTVRQAIGDLPPVSPGEDASGRDYLCPAQNPYQQLMRGQLSPQDFVDQLKGPDND